MERKFAVFAGYHCGDSNIGWNTYRDSFTSYSDAFSHVRDLMQNDEMEWAQIVDIEKRQLIAEF